MDYIREIYAKIGEIIKIIQFIEWNLCLKLEISGFAEFTLGQIKSMILESKILNENMTGELVYILDKRNDLIHQYFKRLEFEKHSDNTPFLENQFRCFVNLLERIESFNEELL